MSLKPGDTAPDFTLLDQHGKPFTLSNASRPDFEKLTEAEQTALAEDLFGWVESGPPRLHRRTAAGVEFYADEVPSTSAVVSRIIALSSPNTSEPPDKAPRSRVRPVRPKVKLSDLRPARPAYLSPF